MAITANKIIHRAMRLLQQLTPDASPTAQEAADGLYALNSMLDAWTIERLMVYQIRQTTHTWPANTTSRTIGSGGDFNTSWPVRLEETGSFFRDRSSIDYPVRALPREQYDLITYKSAKGSTPEYLYYDYAFPIRNLYAYPVPSQQLTLYLDSWQALQQFTGQTSEINMPPGYQAAIEYNLALWIAPEFGAAAKAAAKDIEKQAGTLKQAIRGMVQPNMVSSVDLYQGRGRHSRILSDT